MTTKCVKPWLVVRRDYPHYREGDEGEGGLFCIRHVGKSPVSFQRELHAREWGEHSTSQRNNPLFVRWVGPSLQLLFTTLISIHTTGLSTRDLFNSGSSSLAGGQIIPETSHFFFLQVASHAGHVALPHIRVSACADPSFLRWLTEQPTAQRPKGCFQIWSPKGNLAQLLQACSNTDPFSQLCSRTWFLLCLSKPRRRKAGWRAAGICPALEIIPAPLFQCSPPNSNRSPRVKGERQFFQMQYVTDNQPIGIQRQ